MIFEEFYQFAYPSLFYQWIALNQAKYKKDHIHFETTHEDEHYRVLIFQMKQVIGKIVIWYNNIVEQYIQNKEGDQIFYLHYEMTSLSQATHLFTQFYNSLLYHEQRKVYKIALCCTGGLTSSVFADEIQEVCLMENTPLKLYSVSLKQIKKNLEYYDAIYLAPQAAYEKPYLMLKIKTPIYCIDATDYATKNFRKILQTIKKEMLKEA